MEILNTERTKLNNTIELIGKPSENNILIVGVVHGDEPQGKYLIEEYLKTHYNFPSNSNLPTSSKSPILRRGTLFIPCLNPDGLQLNRRTNANNVDINRNFPTKNWGKNEGDNATCDDETTNYFGGKFSCL